MNDIPPLPWLRAFEAASRNGNFSSAGEELGLTPAAISHQVRALEEQLGYPLFSREKRPMELTAMGELYLPWVIKAFETLRLGTRDVFGTRGTRPVRIRCLPTFAQVWLLKQLPDFRARYPEVNMQLHMGTWASAIQSNQLDIEIRFGNGDWPGQRATLLGRHPVVPVCHPDLQPTGSTLDALRDSSLIEIIGVADNWHQFFLQENLRPPAQIPALSVDQSIAALELAASGMGHALVSELFAAPYLQDGRLVHSLPIEKHTDQAVYITHPEGPVSYACQVFVDWIIEQSSAMRQV
ncbi:LysR family transcriptional regulator [Roseovarius gahaiensis]|uniref:LysR family transcriptional regulator n=1 Tax=Roseovarius gahaiensis TaxID=2716691 RepID=A0A967BF68_9RHOB|nr:LysR substrate-binding domain-containing protein [Roseovarius gahaiensis]NHQ75239.1 LysR family transcriptional regulator [Roseovarius gahaiensis]